MPVDALALLFPVPALAAVLAAAGAGVGPVLARFAARRTVAQPLVMALAEESALLASVLVQPQRLPYLTPLSAADFAAGAHGRIWAALRAAAPECDALPEDASDELCAATGQVLAARATTFLEDVREALLAGVAPVGDVERLDALLVAGREAQLDDAKAMEVASAVLDAGQDRNRLSGAGLVLPTSLPDSTDPDRPPLHRVHVPPSVRRVAWTSALTAVAASLVPGMVHGTGLAGAAAVVAGLSLTALLFLSVVISLVDVDTFYIDLRVFGMSATMSWALAVVATALDGSWGRLLDGGGIVLGTALVFEGANRVHRLIRGQDGQGFGDTLIVLATAGVPAALAGSWTLGYASVMAGMLLGVAGWGVGALAGRLGRKSPFAFGPYLAAGWVVAWAVTLAS